MVRSGKCPLTQISNRLEEYNRHIVVDIIPEQCKAISLKYPKIVIFITTHFVKLLHFQIIYIHAKYTNLNHILI